MTIVVNSTHYYPESSDTIAPVADAVKKHKKSPASRPVEWGTGVAYEGGNNESQSSPELLYPTVHELCKILNFPEDVKNKVDGFLDFVLKNYNCWIGASLAKHKIDRKESFDLAKQQLNFDCKKDQVNSVHLKLEEAKEDFLNQIETQEKHVEIKDLKSPPQENLESTEKLSEEMEELNREWDDRRAYLENEYKVEKAIIRTLQKKPSIRSEKLRLLDKEFAKKIEEHERDKDKYLKELKATKILHSFYSRRHGTCSTFSFILANKYQQSGFTWNRKEVVMENMVGRRWMVGMVVMFDCVEVAGGEM
ncbi:unnamed protein product [Lactuca virosa]|uniref:MOM1 alpha-helical domain-containing protein n=1 Tax=Lactuca virosa TaxID=75947 RepID=A0AAU9PMV5_9ASTR|nr:unnamed protein product [Lactuca virosa]